MGSAVAKNAYNLGMAKSKSTKRKTAKPADSVRTLTAVAAHFKVSVDVVRRSWRQNGMPVETGSDGKPLYPLKAIEEWRATRRQPPHDRAKENVESASSVMQEKRQWESRIKEEEFKAKRLRNQVLMGDYVARDEVERFFAAVFSVTRDLVEQMPVELKASFPAEFRDEMFETLSNHCQLVLKTIHAKRDKIEEMARAEVAR